MTTATFRRLGQSELLPRYLFAEQLFVRRRVLELGAISTTGGQSAQFLLTRGARAVVACDEDLTAVEDAQARLGSSDLRFRPFVLEDLESQSFDLILVSDLSSVLASEDLAPQLSRLLARNGHLLGGLRNPAGLALAQVMDPEQEPRLATYGQVLEALQPHFASIQVATQSPFLGYQLAFDSAEGLEIEGSLAGQSEAAYFVVLAGLEPVRNLEPIWVQLPPEPLAYTTGRLEEYAARTRSWEERASKGKETAEQLRTELASKDVSVTRLAQELEEARSELAHVRAHVEVMEAHPEGTRHKDELAATLRRKEAHLHALEERAKDAERQRQEVSEELERSLAAQEDAAQKILAAQEEARLERARREELSATLDELRAKVERADAEIETARDEASAALVELERSKLRESKALEEARTQAALVAEGRAREVELARRASEAHAAIESLRQELLEAREATRAAAEEVHAREAERQKALRAMELAEDRARELRGKAEEAKAEALQAFEASGRLALETELASLATEREALTSALKQSEARIASLEAVGIRAEQRAGEAEAAKDEARKESEDLRSQLDIVRAKVTRLEREMADAAAQASLVGSSRVDLQACKLEYSIVSPK